MFNISWIHERRPKRASAGSVERRCGRSRWPAPQMRGHFSTELRCSYTCQLNSGETPKKNLCTRDGRGERWGQRTRGMRGCSCAERACACGPGARAQRRALRLGRTRLRQPPSKFSNGRAKCRFKRRGEGYCSRTPGTNRKAVGLETCRVNPSHTNLLHHLSQKLSLLLVLLVHSVCGGAIHVNKLPRPSGHY